MSRGRLLHHLLLLLRIRYIYSTQRKQQYRLPVIKFVHANLPQAGFELRSPGSQAYMVPIESHLLVFQLFIIYAIALKYQFLRDLLNLTVRHKINEQKQF